MLWHCSGTFFVVARYWSFMPFSFHHVLIGLVLCRRIWPRDKTQLPSFGWPHRHVDRPSGRPTFYSSVKSCALGCRTPTPLVTLKEWEKEKRSNYSVALSSRVCRLAWFGEGARFPTLYVGVVREFYRTLRLPIKYNCYSNWVIASFSAVNSVCFLQLRSKSRCFPLFGRSHSID